MGRGRRFFVIAALAVGMYAGLLYSGLFSVWLTRRTVMIYNETEIQKTSYSLYGIVTKTECFDKDSAALTKEFSKRVRYFKNGKLVTEMNMKAGIQNGVRTDWWNDGKKMREVESADGEISSFRAYNVNGELVSECIWKKGAPVEGVQLGIDPETGTFEKETYVDGKVTGRESGISKMFKNRSGN